MDALVSFLLSLSAHLIKLFGIMACCILTHWLNQPILFTQQRTHLTSMKHQIIIVSSQVWYILFVLLQYILFTSDNCHGLTTRWDFSPLYHSLYYWASLIQINASIPNLTNCLYIHSRAVSRSLYKCISLSACPHLPDSFVARDITWISWNL